jgi:hypothetical protein
MSRLSRLEAPPFDHPKLIKSPEPIVTSLSALNFSIV